MYNNESIGFQKHHFVEIDQEITFEGTEKKKNYKPFSLNNLCLVSGSLK